MKSKNIWCFIGLLLLVTACEKEPSRTDNFRIEFATVLKPAEKTTFQLDNHKILIPKELKDYSGKDGQRVVVNYTPWRGDTVKVNNVSDIFTGSIKTSDAPDKLTKDPLKIQSVWVGANYLNLILEIEYYNKSHTIGLFRDTNASGIELHLSHSKNNDPPGYAQKLYASFSLAAIQSANGSPTPFRLFINTPSGTRVFELEVK